MEKPSISIEEPSISVKNPSILMYFDSHFDRKNKFFKKSLSRIFIAISNMEFTGLRNLYSNFTTSISDASRG